MFSRGQSANQPSIHYLSVFLLACLLVSHGASSVPYDDPSQRVSENQLTKDTVTRLLQAANVAMEANRLMSPVHDNAFDRFRAILMLQPGNSQAKLGLGRITQRYIDLAKGAAARGDYTKALSFLARARHVSPNNGVVDTLASEFAKARSFRRMPAQRPPAEDRVYFDVRQLDQRSEQVVQQLQKAARRVRDQGNTLLIVARNDGEGRWMYSKMKKAVPGYLLRGDIKVGPEPRVVFLPPIE